MPQASRLRRQGTEKAAKPEKEVNDERKLKLAKAYQATLQISDNEDMEDTMSEE
jgi:hypothetical protein